MFFVKSTCIMELDWTTEVVKEVYSFKRPLSRQPEFFQMNDKQTIMMAASPEDGIYVNYE